MKNKSCTKVKSRDPTNKSLLAPHLMFQWALDLRSATPPTSGIKQRTMNKHVVSKARSSSSTNLTEVGALIQNSGGTFSCFPNQSGTESSFYILPQVGHVFHQRSLENPDKISFRETGSSPFRKKEKRQEAPGEHGWAYYSACRQEDTGRAGFACILAFSTLYVPVDFSTCHCGRHGFPLHESESGRHPKSFVSREPFSAAPLSPVSSSFAPTPAAS
jgi:hypothetical protein